MLWAGIDPADHDGNRLHSLKNDLPPKQYRKAWMSLRAVSEAVSGITLPFVEAWKLHDDRNGDWEKKIEFPDLPDPNKLIPEKTRVRQAVFMKWAESKKIPSYRQEIIRHKSNVRTQTGSQLVDVCGPIPTTVTATLVLPAPDFRDPLNPASPLELMASAEVWEIITAEEMHGKGKTVKTVAKQVLNTHPEFKAMSNSAKERIATVVNWEPQGGAPKTRGR